MTRQLSDDQVRALRLRAQQLAPRPAGSASSVAAIVQAVCGVQAQEAPAAALSVRARLSGLLAADVERAQVDERSIVRTWAVRGTLHLVAAEDVGWLLALLGPRFIQSSRGRRAQLGLDDATGARAVRALRDVLAAQGPLTRAEITEQLARRGLRLAGQARPHLLRLAALEGVICQGPNRGREPAYVLLEDWIDPGPALPAELARAELARRYLSAFAPATPADFAAWSGLALGEARAAWQHLARQLTEVQVEGAPAWLLRVPARWPTRVGTRQPAVRLVPSYDTYLLGYRSRDLLIAPEHARRVYPGGGLLRPALLVNGWAAGTWQLKRQRAQLEVVVEPFAALPAAAQPGLQAEVAAIGCFLGAPAVLTVLPPR